jgi:hypothetical protein
MRRDKMGYSFTIGQLEIDYSNESDEPYIDISAKGERLDDAPAFDEPTDYTNERWPSYSVWRDFCRTAGLIEMFYGEDREKNIIRDDYLIMRHPGCVPLTEAHRSEINEAMVRFMSKYPKAVATYGNQKGFEADPNNPKENSVLCRLTWLHFWINWALDNCDKPVFANS